MEKKKPKLTQEEMVEKYLSEVGESWNEGLQVDSISGESSSTLLVLYEFSDIPQHEPADLTMSFGTAIEGRSSFKVLGWTSDDDRMVALLEF